MPRILTCKCGRKIPVRSKLEGRELVCPGCNRRLRVRTRSEAGFEAALDSAVEMSAETPDVETPAPISDFRANVQKTCPTCEHEFLVPKTQKRIRCPKCGTEWTVKRKRRRKKNAAADAGSPARWSAVQSGLAVIYFSVLGAGFAKIVYSALWLVVATLLTAAALFAYIAAEMGGGISGVVGGVFTLAVLSPMAAAILVAVYVLTLRALCDDPVMRMWIGAGYLVLLFGFGTLIGLTAVQNTTASQTLLAVLGIVVLIDVASGIGRLLGLVCCAWTPPTKSGAIWWVICGCLCPLLAGALVGVGVLLRENQILAVGLAATAGVLVVGHHFSLAMFLKTLADYMEERQLREDVNAYMIRFTVFLVCVLIAAGLHWVMISDLSKVAEATTVDQLPGMGLYACLPYTNFALLIFAIHLGFSLSVEVSSTRDGIESMLRR